MICLAVHSAVVECDADLTLPAILMDASVQKVMLNKCVQAECDDKVCAGVK